MVLNTYFSEAIDSEEESALVIKEEPEEIIQSEETSENELTNHIPLKNGRLSPKSPPSEPENEIVNQTGKTSANKKELNMNVWANNIRLRHQVCKELKKPGRSKYR